MPRHKWMSDLFDDITDNIGEIFAYAKSNFREQHIYNKIKEITNIVKEQLERCE